MFSDLLKSLSILKKFLFINFIFFTIIGLFTFLYLKNVQPNLIKKKSSNHIEVINNTIDNLTRLKVKFIDMLSKCRFQNIEIGSFVSPKWVPQMANSPELINLIENTN